MTRVTFFWQEELVRYGDRYAEIKNLKKYVERFYPSLLEGRHVRTFYGNGTPKVVYDWHDALIEAKNIGVVKEYFNNLSNK